MIRPLSNSSRDTSSRPFSYSHPSKCLTHGRSTIFRAAQRGPTEAALEVLATLRPTPQSSPDAEVRMDVLRKRLMSILTKDFALDSSVSRLMHHCHINLKVFTDSLRRYIRLCTYSRMPCQPELRACPTPSPRMSRSNGNETSSCCRLRISVSALGWAFLYPTARV